MTKFTHIWKHTRNTGQYLTRYHLSVCQGVEGLPNTEQFEFLHTNMSVLQVKYCSYTQVQPQKFALQTAHIKKLNAYNISRT